MCFVITAQEIDSRAKHNHFCPCNGEGASCLHEDTSIPITIPIKLIELEKYCIIIKIQWIDSNKNKTSEIDLNFVEEIIKVYINKQSQEWLVKMDEL